MAHGPTYLHLAALRHRGGILCHNLVEAGADVKHEMELEGRFKFLHLTPYQTAVLFGNINCLRAMLPLLRPRDLKEELSVVTRLDQGLGIEAGAAKGGSLLSFAADAGRLDIYRLLIEHGAKLDPFSFLYAVQGNYLELVQYLLQTLRMDVNYIMTKDVRKADPIDQAHRKHDSALHGAAERGLEQMAELLIRHGAHVNAVSEMDHMRPLDVALQTFNGACRKYTIYLGRDVNCSGVQATIDLLRRHGANPGLGENRQYLSSTSYATRLAQREAMLLETFGPEGMPKPLIINVTEDDRLQTDAPQVDWEERDERMRRDEEDRVRKEQEHYQRIRDEERARVRRFEELPEAEKERLRQETLAAIAPGSQTIENQIKRAIQNNPNGEVEKKLKARQEAMQRADERAAANARNMQAQVEAEMARRAKKQEL